MFGLNSATNEHLEVLQNHHKIHSGMVLSCWLLVVDLCACIYWIKVFGLCVGLGKVG